MNVTPPRLPSLHETDLLLLSSRIFTGQHLASYDRLIRSSTICYPCARSVPAISLSRWERAGVRVKAGIGARGNNDTQTRPPTGASIVIPSCAGASRHERLVRKHVPDSNPGWIPAPAGDTNHHRPVNAAGLYQLMRDRSYNGRIIKQLFVLSRAHPDDRANPVLSST